VIPIAASQALIQSAVRPGASVVTISRPPQEARRQKTRRDQPFVRSTQPSPGPNSRIAHTVAGNVPAETNRPPRDPPARKPDDLDTPTCTRPVHRLRQPATAGARCRDDSRPDG